MLGYGVGGGGWGVGGEVVPPALDIGGDVLGHVLTLFLDRAPCPGDLSGLRVEGSRVEGGV